MQAGDHELLRSFCREGNEEAFRELMERHLGMVHRVAARMLRDPSLAEDVAQKTFVLLARKGGLIRPGQTLAGWLYRTARHEALHVQRTEYRRRRREEEALTMQTGDSHEEQTRIVEALEVALGELKAVDRDVLVLRFLEARTLLEVGRELGIAEDTARMRVNRALERLRRVFEKRGLAVSGGLLSSAMLSEADAVLPEGLRESVLSVALANVAVTGAGTGTASLFGWLNAKAGVVTVGAIAVVGAGIYWFQSGSGPGVSEPVFPEQTAVATEEAGVDGTALAGGTVAAATGAGSAGTAGAGEELPTAQARALVEQALLLLADGRYEDARDLVTRALELSPRYPEAYLVRGKALFALRQLSATDPGSSSALRERERLGLIHPDSAEASFTRAIELRPAFAAAWFERSRVYAELRQYDAVIRDAGQAIEHDPEMAEAWLGKGEACYHRDDDDKALAVLDRAVELDRALAEAYHFRALIFLRRDEPEKALENRRMAVAVDPGNFLQHHRLGQTLHQLRREEDSLEHFTRALELNPGYHPAYQARGQALERLGRVKEAVADYSNCLRLSPQTHSMVAVRGRAYVKLEEWEKARMDFERAIRLAENCPFCNEARTNPQANPGRATQVARNLARNHAGRGHAYVRLGRFEEAARDFDRAVELSPGFESALVRSAWTHERLGNIEQALIRYSQALEVSPNSAETQLQIERLTGEAGRARKAKEETP